MSTISSTPAWSGPRHPSFPRRSSAGSTRVSSISLVNRYAAYGARLDSAVLLAGLPTATGAESHAVEFVLDTGCTTADEGPHAPAVLAFGAEEGSGVSLHVNGAVEIHSRGRFTFRLTPGLPEIWCRRGADGAGDVIERWLLQYVLPMHLMIERRREFLHAGAVRAGDGAVAFVGPSGAGKSTIVDHFLRRGHGLLTDDKLAIVREPGRVVGVPGIPFYCADPAKQRIDHAADFVERPLPLRAVYLLEPAASTASPRIDPVRPAAAAFALARRCELQVPSPVREALTLPPPWTQAIALGVALADRVPVRRLAVPRRLARLGDVYEAVLADLAQTA